jgi:hypothetical protein
MRAPDTRASVGGHLLRTRSRRLSASDGARTAPARVAEQPRDRHRRSTHGGVGAGRRALRSVQGSRLFTSRPFDDWPFRRLGRERSGSNSGSKLRATQSNSEQLSPLYTAVRRLRELDRSGWGPGGRRFKSCLPDHDCPGNSSKRLMGALSRGAIRGARIAPRLHPVASQFGSPPWFRNPATTRFRAGRSRS